MDSRSDMVQIRLPTGEPAWVTPEAFNLISEREFEHSERLRQLETQRNIAIAIAGFTLLFSGAVSLGLAAKAARSTVQETRVASSAALSSPGPASPAPSSAVSASPVASSPIGEPAMAAPEASPGPGLEDDSVVVAGAPAATPVVDLADDPSDEPEVRSIAREIESTILAWAQSWASQDIERYLSFYGSAFQPPAGMTRTAWEAQRRQRIERPARIAVTVSDVEASVIEPGRAVARFGQRYRTPDYRDRVLKTLELASEAGRWRIVDERAAPIETDARSSG